MDDENVLFLHPVGLDSAAASWLDLPQLRSPTLLGHHPRARGGDRLTIERMADEVIGWTSTSVDLVGVSLGGMVAMRCAIDHPEHVRSLLLACTTARPDARVIEERAATAAREDPRQVTEATLSRWFLTESMETSDHRGVAYARERLLAQSGAALADIWRAISRHDVLDRLTEIAVPTTIVFGTHDRSTAPAHIQQLAQGIRGSRLVEIDAAHMAFLERPTQFTQIVRDHLRAARAGFHSPQG